MKKTNVILLILFCFSWLIIPVMAAEESNSDNSLSFTDMVKAKESYNEVKNSDLNKPIEQTNKYVIGGIEFLVFIALSIGLIKYIYGNSNQSSDGFMSMGKVVLGIAFFIFCGIMSYTILSWK